MIKDAIKEASKSIIISNKYEWNVLQDKFMPEKYLRPKFTYSLSWSVI